ncbi:MAG TPA: hypothetical protein VIM18_00195 [Solirubrobacteraceae bacterium]
MSTSEPLSGEQPTEEELRAAYEEEIKKIRVEQGLLEHVVTLINLGMRRTGLAPGTESERDQTQVRLAIEAVRAMLPLIEQIAPAQVKPIRDALSQLQLAFVRIGGQPETPDAPAQSSGEPSQQAEPGPQAPPPPSPEPGSPEEGGGPAQRSGRLWIPGQ